jgi:hypothetical protein
VSAWCAAEVVGGWPHHTKQRGGPAAASTRLGDCQSVPVGKVTARRNSSYSVCSCNVTPSQCILCVACKSCHSAGNMRLAIMTQPRRSSAPGDPCMDDA